MSLDSFDRKLLAAVQKTNQLNADALGGTVGLSLSACLRRLRDSGVIEPEVAMAAPETVGRNLMMAASCIAASTRGGRSRCRPAPAARRSRAGCGRP